MNKLLFDINKDKQNDFTEGNAIYDRQDINEINSSANAKKHYDKSNLMKNIRYLVDENKNIKLGQIEKEAGNQPGYMSRVEKKDNSSEPNLEFVVTAAKLLNTTVDDLIFGELSELTETEKYIEKFINKVIKDTQNEVLIWEKETESMLNNLTKYAGGKTSNIFYQWESTFGGTTYVSYCSKYYQNEDVSVEKSMYHCNLEFIGADMYLIPCIKDDEQFLELYIVDRSNEEDVISTICCSNQVCNTIKDLCERLHKEIMNSLSHVHINHYVRNAIDSYMKNDD